MNLFRKSKYSIYSPKTYIYQYNDNDFRLVHLKCVRESGWELEEKKQFSLIPQTDSEEIQRISLSRSKRNIRELALCNDFEYFATITVNNEFCDRFHLEQCQTLLRKKFKKIKRSHPNFAYLFITEKHENGAFHFHGLIKGLDDFYTNDNGYLSHKTFDEIGFNSFSAIRDYSKCCNYICKYITKDCVKNEHNQIYFCSKGLKKAQREELKNFDFEPTFENEFCKIRDFQINSSDNLELIKDLLTYYPNNAINMLD